MINSEELKNWELALETNSEEIVDIEKHIAENLTDSWIEKSSVISRPSNALIDVFEPKGKGLFSVKSKSKSKILWGHIKLEEPINGEEIIWNKATEFPVTPWINLQELLMFYNNIDPTDKVISTKFLSVAFPKQSLSVKGNSLYINEDEIVRLSIEDDENIFSVETILEKKYIPTKLQKEHLLQKPPFRFIDGIAIEEGAEKARTWTQFQWTFAIPEDFPWQDAEKKIATGILIEFAGQTWSAAISPYLNSGSPSVENPQNNGEKIANWMWRFFTFASSTSKATSTKAKAGDTLLLTGRILDFNPEKAREVKFCYTIQNTSGEELLSWEMGGTITIMKFFWVGFVRYKRILKEALQKDIYRMIGNGDVAISDETLLKEIITDSQAMRELRDEIQTRLGIDLYTMRWLEWIVNVGDLVELLNQEVNEL